MNCPPFKLYFDIAKDAYQLDKSRTYATPGATLLDGKFRLDKSGGFDLTNKVYFSNRGLAMIGLRRKSLRKLRSFIKKAKIPYLKRKWDNVPFENCILEN